MARAYASIILKAPVETVWSLVRDFNGLPKWAPNIAKSLGAPSGPLRTGRFPGQ